MNKEDKPLKVAIKTFGCQMNMYDTEVAEGFFSSAGFEVVHEPDGGEMKLPSSANGEVRADVILMNTCSVRENAEERVYGRLAMLGKAKEKNPNLVLGLMGCMVEEHREKLFRRFPQLDLMVGTRNIKELPSLVKEVLETRKQTARIRQEGISIEYSEQIQRRGKHHAWLPIMTGCNKVCTYCIVPVTRGKEVSMPARDVFREASRLAEEGVKWITLLGQNVNSYDSDGILSKSRRIALEPGSSSAAEGENSKFPQLLDMLCRIDGLEKISFTTSHPHDATEALYQVIARNPKISRHFHLPLQSGSDRMLKRMKRLHTYADFKKKIERMRELIPDVSVTTDIIVGFSGETEEDYEGTVRALREIRFDDAYIYKYSVRPGTPAAKLEDDVPLDVKERRNAELLKIQTAIRDENNLALVGKTFEAFVDAESGRNPGELKARLNQEKTVLFSGPQDLIGRLVRLQLRELRSETFIGSLV